MANIISAKAISRLTVLLVLILCLIYLQHPPRSAALTCKQNCEAQDSQCVKGCRGSEGCIVICAEALRGCLNGCP